MYEDGEASYTIGVDAEYVTDGVTATAAPASAAYDTTAGETCMGAWVLVLPATYDTALGAAGYEVYA